MIGSIEDSAGVIRGLTAMAGCLAQASAMVIEALRGGGKILTVGNGGSAAEAMHMAEELVGRFRTNRRSLPGIALTADGTALTCIANDFGYDFVFSRQVEGLGVRGDVLVLFSTSGRAMNLRHALEAARRQGLRIISVLGRDGGDLRGLADVDLCVAGKATERIQEAHQVILHLLLDEVEHAFVSS
ncbi:MAG TPA: phosphoheptose isomerase [Verrucomicrobia bacterium]|nr:phosphoheptose isomerase [Verrucomicrobiota bacterium]